MSSLGSKIEGADCISVANDSNSNTGTLNMLPVDAGMPVAAVGITIASGSNSSGYTSRLTRLSCCQLGCIDMGIQQQSSTNIK
eukprot:4211304-Ditylum_brightwellii.AAC.1